MLQLAIASEHYSQNLRRRGVKGLVYNVVEQQQLRQRAELHFHKRTMAKYFTKVMLRVSGINVRRVRSNSIADESSLQ